MSEPTYGEGLLSAEQRQSLFRGRDLAALNALARIYGDSTDDIINALHSVACRVAIACEVDPQQFAQGLKYHWDDLVRFLESDDSPSLPPSDAENT